MCLGYNISYASQAVLPDSVTVASISNINIKTHIEKQPTTAELLSSMNRILGAVRNLQLSVDSPPKLLGQ